MPEREPEAHCRHRMIAVNHTSGMRHEDILARVDWSAVEHAHPRSAGVPETPEILMALLSNEAATQAKALGDLNGLVHHQDTIYSATPPAVDFVTAILGDLRATHSTRPGQDADAGLGSCCTAMRDRSRTLKRKLR